MRFEKVPSPLCLAMLLRVADPRSAAAMATFLYDGAMFKIHPLQRFNFLTL
jgi:hypothetical protein